ncbi:MAG: efflux RND transporter periplasmic adaptor subunit [Bacillota bacterium]
MAFNKRNMFTLLTIAVVLLVASGPAIKKIKPVNTYQAPRVSKVPVETVPVKADSISAAINYSGTVVSNNDTVISSKIIGRITSLPVKEGDVVRKGDLLCVIDDSEYSGKINTLRQRVSTAELNFQFLDQQLAKYEQLYKAQATSELNYLQYKLQRDVAASQLEEARFSLRELEIALDSAYIKAPFNGIVSSLQSRIGDMAMAGKPILILSDTNSLKAQVKVTENDLAAIREGMEVVLSSSLLSGILKSRVEKIYPSADPQTRTTMVEILLPGAILKPGTSVNVAFLLGSREKTLVVPAGSMMEDKAGHYVYVVKEGKAVRRNVTTGIKNDTMVEITGGLAEGEEIIASDLAGVRDGKEVYVFKKEGGDK